MAYAISVEGVSKRYTLHHRPRSRYGTLREEIADGARSMMRRLRANTEGPSANTDEEFWALKNVSFTVDEGDRLGIIGRNGAGKSTLLKVLSRITDPTEGRIAIRGRLSSLLEVGTGFHPELTGRENIYLNGTILGMSSREIRRKFDEIVAFAEIERFLDTPVKRYSSGMYVRLAFAVAAHLEPDILVLDEVLAVGDAQFQKKCLGKMQEVNSEGRTVLIVSHNMTIVKSLCSKCLFLDRGKLSAYGAAEDVTKLYFGDDTGQHGTSVDFSSDKRPPGDDIACLVSARLIDSACAPASHARIDQSIGVEMTFDVVEDRHILIPNFHVFTQGQLVFISAPPQRVPLQRGRYRTTMWIPENLLNEGLYVVGLAVTSLNPTVVHFFEQEAIYFRVKESLVDESGDGDSASSSLPGLVRPKLAWTFEIADTRAP
jgi:lipopolysaccharide transport system ATP-binding protein